MAIKSFLRISIRERRRIFGGGDAAGNQDARGAGDDAVAPKDLDDVIAVLHDVRDDSSRWSVGFAVPHDIGSSGRMRFMARSTKLKSGVVSPLQHLSDLWRTHNGPERLDCLIIREVFGRG